LAHAPAARATHGEGFRTIAATGWRAGGCVSLRPHPTQPDMLLSGGGDGTIRHGGTAILKMAHQNFDAPLFFCMDNHE
jgi:hypothetical protein